MEQVPPAALLLLAFGGIACEGGPDAFVTTFDPCQPLVLELPAGATPAQRDSVIAAIAMWNEAVPTGLSIGPADGAVRLPLHFVDTKIYYGWYDDRDVVIRLSNQVTAAKARTLVLAHELGHAFGLYHVDKGDRRSVMNPGRDTTPPTEADVQALEAVWGACVRGR